MHEDEWHQKVSEDIAREAPVGRIDGIPVFEGETDMESLFGRDYEGVQPYTPAPVVQTPEVDWNDDPRTDELYDEIDRYRDLWEEAIRDNSKLINLLELVYMEKQLPDYGLLRESVFGDPATQMSTFPRRVWVVDSVDSESTPSGVPSYVVDSKDNMWTLVNRKQCLWQIAEGLPRVLEWVELLKESGILIELRSVDFATEGSKGRVFHFPQRLG